MSTEMSMPRTEPNTSFGSLKQIDAGELNVGYAQAGPADGPTVVLLHGWPYDIHSYVDVAPLPAAKGYRVIIPYLRGYGTTRFLSDETPRNGQQSVVALDTIAFMDALQIDRAIVAGFDWGARTAGIIAALWPERCRALVSVSGYPIGSQKAGMVPYQDPEIEDLLRIHHARPQRSSLPWQLAHSMTICRHACSRYPGPERVTRRHSGVSASICSISEPRYDTIWRPHGPKVRAAPPRDRNMSGGSASFSCRT